MPEFAATICKIGINPVVDPPDEVLESIFAAAGRDKGPIRVRGRINGIDFAQTLVRYRGRWRLYINGGMCGSAGVSVGDAVKIVLAYDPTPRVDLEPEKLTEALLADPAARTAFDALTPSRRREIINYLGSLKTEEAVVRNVAKVVKSLIEKL